MLAMAKFRVFSPTCPLLAFSIYTATQLTHTILILDTVGHQQGLGAESTCRVSTWLCCPLPIHFLALSLSFPIGRKKDLDEVSLKGHSSSNPVWLACDKSFLPPENAAFS